MKKIIFILIILFSTSLTYAEEAKSVVELEEEVNNLSANYEKKQKEISEMKALLSALSVRIHEANVQLQAARREEAAKSREP